MSRGVNKVILLGHLGKDPETRYTEGGGAITSFSMATSESWKDKQTGELQERTEWHRVKMFGRLAEIAGEYLRKGKQVYIEGSLRTDKYTDKEGIERYTTGIIANEMQMLGGGEGGGDRGQERSEGERSRSQSSRDGDRGQARGGARDDRPSGRSGHHDAQGRDVRGSGATQGRQGAPRREAPPADDFEDDIPFL